MTTEEIKAKCDKLIESRGAFSVPIAKSLKIALETFIVIKSIEDFGTIGTAVKLSDEALAAIAKEFDL